MSPNIQEPEKKIQPHVEEALKIEARNETQIESQVIVHGSIEAFLFEDGARIWKTTYLVDKTSPHRSNLLMAENIRYYPEWSRIVPGETLNFTLIFEGLPKSCTSFDLVEQIPEPGGFIVKNIARNKSDVYFLDFT